MLEENEFGVVLEKKGEEARRDSGLVGNQLSATEIDNMPGRLSGEFVGLVPSYCWPSPCAPQYMIAVARRPLSVGLSGRLLIWLKQQSVRLELALSLQASRRSTY